MTAGPTDPRRRDRNEWTDGSRRLWERTVAPQMTLFRTLGVRILASSLALTLAGAPLAVAAPATNISAPAQPAAASVAATGTASTDTSTAIGSVDTSSADFRGNLTAKQRELETLKSQLADLDLQLDVASEAYNAAVVQLDSIKAQLATTEQDLTNADAAYAQQSSLLSTRADGIYRQGDLNVIDMVLGSHSLADLVKRIQFMNTIGASDASLAEQLKNQAAQIETAKADLVRARQQAEAAEFDLKARRIEIELRIQERQQMLDAAQTDLVAMLQQEAQRRSVQESALFAAILAGAGNIGIQVTPGTPVETALAYHGVPYLWGGATPAAFDCSGLVMYVFAQHGVFLPHYSGSQFLLGQKVGITELAPGDVVFFGSPIHHVGIYLGAGYFLHAPHTGDYVKISRLADRGDFAGARRYDWQPRIIPIAGLDQISKGNVDHSAGIPLNAVVK
jgi:peptidoglycan DL-endopeptidase CwlO